MPELRAGLFVALLIILPSAFAADPLRVAVAANFRDAFGALQGRYRPADHELEASFAATGILYAQITHGAPFDVLLAADRERPAQLAAAGFGANDSRFTYAIGQLVLWIPGATEPVDAQSLRRYRGRLAIANPELAPYGASAKAVLMALYPEFPPQRLVIGTSVTQATHYVASGAAAAGLLAYPMLRERPHTELWQVPPIHHQPIEQQAIAISGGRLAAAREFLAFLASDPARQVIVAAGYRVPDRPARP